MGDTTTLTIRVDKAMKERLERAAKQQRRSKAFIALEAITEYLAVQEWQEQRIREAVASADAGEGVAHGRVRNWVESWDTESEIAAPKA